MTNPFDDKDATYMVLVNAEGQHSMWPAFVDVPAGWTIVFGQADRDACHDYIEKNWADMRPASLIRELGETP